MVGATIAAFVYWFLIEVHHPKVIEWSLSNTDYGLTKDVLMYYRGILNVKVVLMAEVIILRLV